MTIQSYRMPRSDLEYVRSDVTQRVEWNGMDLFGKFENPHLLTRQPQRPPTSPRAHHPDLHSRSHIVHLTNLMKSRKPLIPLIKPMKQERQLRILPNIHATPFRLNNTHNQEQRASDNQHTRKYDPQPQDADVGLSDAELATDGVVAGIANVIRHCRREICHCKRKIVRGVKARDQGR